MKKDWNSSAQYDIDYEELTVEDYIDIAEKLKLEVWLAKEELQAGLEGDAFTTISGILTDYVQESESNAENYCDIQGLEPWN